MSETIASILAAHRTGTSPEQTIARTLARIRAHADPAVFIAICDEEDLLAEARSLSALNPEELPLYGVPVAIKDNIDVAGLPTTAACPAYSYKPAADAVVVERLRRAGAIIVGKTNLDQFATGLVGVRSPYGVPRNPFNPALIPGGSSSGSAVAVSAGLVPLALGTDTAGSGRVPAGLNNIVGIKPSLGLLPTTGVVPACRSLDCVSIFALTVDDAFAALEVMTGPDTSDPFSRAMPLEPLNRPEGNFRVGVPRADGRIFCGDRRAELAFDSALRHLNSLDAVVVEIDLAPFLEAARLLYDGPWEAERYAAVGAFIEAHPDAVHPVTRDIILSGNKPLAVDAFRAFYRLAELKAQAGAAFTSVDMLMVPTAPSAYTVAQVEADPVRLNSILGTYTNFVNLLDLAGIAVPALIADDGTPYGVTILAPAGQDAAIAAVGRALHAQTGLRLGASNTRQEYAEPRSRSAPHEISMAVVGAHMSGMPLNGELRILGARLAERAASAPDYRLFALTGAPNKPGLLRVADGEGASIETEIWSLSFEAFGRFVAAVPPPMTIGTVRLSDGRTVKGFLVEAAATDGARDISEFGGWRPFVAMTGN